MHFVNFNARIREDENKFNLKWEKILLKNEEFLKRSISIQKYSSSGTKPQRNVERVERKKKKPD